MPEISKNAGTYRLSRTYCHHFVLTCPSDGRLVGRSVCHNFLQGPREASLPCFIRSTCHFTRLNEGKMKLKILKLMPANLQRHSFSIFDPNEKFYFSSIPCFWILRRHSTNPNYLPMQFSSSQM